MCQFSSPSSPGVADAVAVEVVPLGAADLAVAGHAVAKVDAGDHLAGAEHHRMSAGCATQKSKLRDQAVEGTDRTCG